MTSSSLDLSYRPWTDRDEPAVLDLLNASMPSGPAGAMTSSFLRWKHHDSPFGRSPGLVATWDDRVVGVRLLMRWQLQLPNGRPLRALRAVDTATHPDFLRRGIFKGLTLALLAGLEADEQVDLVFNTPNADSRPGYLRMGWSEVGSLPVWLSPVRPVPFARGLALARKANSSGGAEAATPSSRDIPDRTCPLPRASEAFADEAGLRDLVAARRAAPGARTPLTIDYLRWRYVQAPGLDYRCIPISEKGTLVGVGFGRLRRRADLWEFTLGDVVVRDGDRRTATRVLRGARQSGADHVTTHAPTGSEARSVLRRSAYLKVPAMGIAMVANPRSTAARSLTAVDAWSLSLGDLEVF